MDYLKKKKMTNENMQELDNTISLKKKKQKLKECKKNWTYGISQEELQ